MFRKIERRGNLKNPAYTKKHWLVLLFVAMMMGSSLGLMTNGIGVFYAPMAKDLDVLLGSVSMQSTFMALAKAFAALTVPQVMDRFGLKKMLAFGVGLASLATFAMAFTSHLTVIYILAVLRGIGANYYSLIPMAMILSRWFEEKNGLAMGLASGTSGIIGSLAAPFLTFFIHSYGWRFAMITKSAFVLLLALPIVLFPFTLNPEDEGLLPYGHKKKKGRDVIRPSRVKDVSPTNFIFIALMVLSLLNTFVIFMNSHFPGYGETIGLHPETASLMLSGVMIGNLVWKTVFGIISDKIGPIQTSLGMMGITFIGILMIIFFRNPVALVLGSFLFGTGFSISGVALPILSNEFFGPIAGAKVYSKASFLTGIGGAVGVGLTGFIYDFTGSYIPAFFIALGFIAINATLLVIARNKHLKNQETYS